MQVEQQFNQELSQKDEENKALRLQLETAEAEKKLVEADRKLKDSGSGEESSEAHAMLYKRLNRLNKSASGLLPLNSAQQANSSPAYTAQGRMARPEVFRTSYGGIGDTIYNRVITPMFMRPTPQAFQEIDGAEAAMNPNKLGMLNRVYGGVVRSALTPAVAGL
jgi:hypothetical protein